MRSLKEAICSAESRPPFETELLTPSANSLTDILVLSFILYKMKSTLRIDEMSEASTFSTFFEIWLTNALFLRFAFVSLNAAVNEATWESVSSSILLKTGKSDSGILSDVIISLWSALPSTLSRPTGTTYLRITCFASKPVIRQENGKQNGKQGQVRLQPSCCIPHPTSRPFRRPAPPTLSVPRVAGSPRPRSLLRAACFRR